MRMNGDMGDEDEENSIAKRRRPRKGQDEEEARTTGDTLDDGPEVHLILLLFKLL